MEAQYAEGTVLAMHAGKAAARRWRYDHRIFRMFLHSYMAIMLIPLLVSVIAFTNMYGTAMSTESERLEYMASQYGADMDSRMALVRGLMNQTLLSPQLTRLMQSEGLGRDNALITNAMEFKRYLFSLASSSMIENYLVYFSGADVLFCQSGEVYYDSYEYAEKQLPAVNMDARQWRELLLSARVSGYLPSHMAGTGTLRSVSPDITLYMYPILYNGTIRGSMVAVLRTETLVRAMRSAAGASSDVALWIVDSAGNTQLASSGNSGVKGACETDAPEWIVTSFRSGDTAFTYYVALPKATALANVYRSTGNMLLILLAALALGVGLAVLLARRQGRPLDNISRNLSALYANDPEAGADGQSTPAIGYIDASINRLIDSHNAITDYLGRQTGLVERMFLDKLYAGLFDSEQDIMEMMGHLQLTPIDGAKRLLLMRMENADADGEPAAGEPALDDAGLLTRLLDAELAQTGERSCLRYEPDINSSTLIMSAGGEGDALGEFARALSAAFNRRTHLRLRCALSESFDDYVEVWRMYRNCADALKYGDGDLVMARAQGLRRGLDYTVEQESRIINLALAGKSEGIAGAIEELAAANAGAPPAQLADALHITLLRLRAQISERAPEVCALLEGELDERGGADALCRQAGQRLLAVCAALEPRRTARSNRRLDGVVEFINENYARPDISLSMLADRFNLTQTYLSHAYKEHTGVNISGYIERLRIERAQQLLREGRTLEQTAFDVGYGHVYSFRTAFKRVTGVTPGAYRDGCAAGGAGEADRD